MKFYSPLHRYLVPEVLTIEVHCQFQIPQLILVGLPSRELAESKERIRAALLGSGLEFPKKKITINLAPADIEKRGTSSEFGIAMAIWSQTLKKKLPSKKICFSGELGLDGTIKGDPRVTRTLAAAWSMGCDEVWFSNEDSANVQDTLPLFEHSRLQGLHQAPQCRFFSNLKEAAETFTHLENLPPPLSFISNLNLSRSTRPSLSLSVETPPPPLLAEFKRPLLTAIAGRHHFLILGPKGIGKTTALDWVELLGGAKGTDFELETRFLAELQGRSKTALKQKYPGIRRVGAQVKPAALLGRFQGSGLLPGEYSCAHGGWLIADEFPEWARDSKESLREPLERKVVTLTRAGVGSTELPADFKFAGTGNLCACGEGPEDCRCRPGVRRAYLQKISGPLLDRMDVLLIKRKSKIFRPPTPSEPWEKTAEQVFTLQKHLQSQWGKYPGDLSTLELLEILKKFPHWLDHPCLHSCESLRSKHKWIRIAMTLSAWDASPEPKNEHFQEAAFLRPESQLK